MSGDEAVRRLHLAKWSTRFGAWLIDVIVVGAVVGAVGDVVAPLPAVPSPTGAGFAIDVSFFGGLNGVGLWLYWTVLEGRSGQSAGKMVLGLRVVDRDGSEIDYVTAGIESLGKAFLLPIDCLIGWLAMPGEKVRLFNRVSGTIVIEVEEDRSPPENVEYVYPEE